MSAPTRRKSPRVLKRAGTVDHGLTPAPPTSGGWVHEVSIPHTDGNTRVDFLTRGYRVQCAHELNGERHWLHYCTYTREHITRLDERENRR